MWGPYVALQVVLRSHAEIGQFVGEVLPLRLAALPAPWRTRRLGVEAEA